MKKSDNFLSDFLFFCRCCSTGKKYGKAVKAGRAGGRYELQTCVGGVAVALNYS